MNTLFYLKEFKDTQKLSLTKKQVEKTLIAQVFCGMKLVKREVVNHHSTEVKTIVKTIALTYCGMCCGCGNCPQRAKILYMLLQIPVIGDITGIFVC